MTDETKKDTLENKNETMDGRKDVESLKQEKVETFMQEMQDQDIDFLLNSLAKTEPDSGEIEDRLVAYREGEIGADNFNKYDLKKLDQHLAIIVNELQPDQPIVASPNDPMLQDLKKAKNARQYINKIID